MTQKPPPIRVVVDPELINPIRVSSSYVRTGRLKSTEDTRLKEIDGMLCGVTQEADGEARVYVFVPNFGAKGPYRVKSDDVETIPSA
jgi:hypothetical protein